MYGSYISLKVLSHNLSQESPLQQHSHTPFQFYSYLYFFLQKGFVHVSFIAWLGEHFIHKKNVKIDFLMAVDIVF